MRATRGSGLIRDDGEKQGRDEEEGGADRRPGPPAEAGHAERVGDAQRRPDEIARLRQRAAGAPCRAP